MDFLNQITTTIRETSLQVAHVIQDPKVLMTIGGGSILVTEADIHKYMTYCSWALVVMSLIIAIPKLFETLGKFWGWIKQFYRWVRR